MREREKGERKGEREFGRSTYLHLRFQTAINAEGI